MLVRKLSIRKAMPGWYFNYVTDFWSFHNCGLEGVGVDELSRLLEITIAKIGCGNIQVR